MSLFNIKNKVVLNASWIIGCRIIQSIFNLIISMLTARFLGPANFGLINYAESIVAFVAPIMQLGFTSIIVHELITEPDNEGEIIGTSILSCLVSGVLCIFAIFIFVYNVNSSEKLTLAVCVLYSLILVVQAFEILSYWFEAHLLSRYSSVISLLAYISVSIYKIFLLVTEKSICWFAISNTLDYLIIAIFQFILYKKLKGDTLSFSFERFKKMFNSGKYYILSGMMIATFSQTDRVMLKLMIGNAVTGIYSAAFRCAGITGFIFSAIINSATPVIYASHNENTDVFDKNIKRLYSIVLYIAFFQSVFMTIFARPIVNILYGYEFSPAIPVLQTITWYVAFSYMGTIRNRWMLAEGKEKLIWRIDLLGAVLNMFLNSIMIPLYGVMGAAITSVFTQFFTNFVLGWFIKDVRRNNYLLVESLNPKILIDMFRNI